MLSQKKITWQNFHNYSCRIKVSKTSCILENVIHYYIFAQMFSRSQFSIPTACIVWAEILIGRKHSKYTLEQRESFLKR